jgi:hypothetical protein
VGEKDEGKSVILRLQACVLFYFYKTLTYFPGAARVFIYLIVICVPSLAEITHLDGIFSIITSTFFGGTLPLFPRRCPGIELHTVTSSH